MHIFIQIVTNNPLQYYTCNQLALSDSNRVWMEDVPDPVLYLGGVKYGKGELFPIMRKLIFTIR